MQLPFDMSSDPDLGFESSLGHGMEMRPPFDTNSGPVQGFESSHDHGMETQRPFDNPDHVLSSERSLGHGIETQQPFDMGSDLGIHALAARANNPPGMESHLVIDSG